MNDRRKPVEWDALEGPEAVASPPAATPNSRAPPTLAGAELHVYDFARAFDALTNHAPFPWQEALYERLCSGDIPEACDIPTGLGKTSVIAVWLLARLAGAPLPRRLVYVVNRRTVVDQTTDEVERLRGRMADAGLGDGLAISTLRGQLADNRAWSADPSKLAVVCGTVDMIGSRLLFGGYGLGFKSRPQHAGLLGQDALIVHDEAHLEPAFQTLLEAVKREQDRHGDRWPLRVMALTATSRAEGPVFGLGKEDLKHPGVKQRIRAAKALSLHQHGDRDLVELVVDRAMRCSASGRAVLVFLRAVDDVMEAVASLRKRGVATQQLTGTMRGFERDRMVSEDPVFRRFLPTNAPEESKAAVLVCTSAGEVGVNLSADHLVCDLTTFDSMAQRFGRVNRFGLRKDTELHVYHPSADALAGSKARDVAQLRATLTLLRGLRGDASPAALGALDPEDRRQAFAPEPEILPATDILFDAWAMTTIRGPLPGRPPVEAYLHGLAEWEPPVIRIAWRDEVDLVTGPLLDRYSAQELLDDYPLRPHELLSDRASRILETLTAVSKKIPDAASAPLWVVHEDGRVDPGQTLGKLCDGDPKATSQRLSGCTLLLSPRRSHPVNGLFAVEGWEPLSGGDADVADAWRGEGGVALRSRVLGDEGQPAGMRLVREIVLGGETDSDDWDSSGEPARWRWYELPTAAELGASTASAPVLLDVHRRDAEREAIRITEPLRLDPATRRAVVLAAQLHDLGKDRRLWQRSIRNDDPNRVLAKSDGAMRPLELSSYRHELGSLLDAERGGLLDALAPEDRDLVLHLIAAHHGRARPHFPEYELFDPKRRDVDTDELALKVAVRFAALQQRFGRWGLAYLESLVRAADYAASAAPSQVVEVTP